MTSSSSTEIRRCRPLLGTFVEIAASGMPEDCLHLAIDRAFSAIERVQRLMSFHEPQSDVSRLNHAAANSPIPVHPWTYQVLSAAEGFHRDSGGVFDITIAPHLLKWGYLPRNSKAQPHRGHSARRPSLQLLPENQVQLPGLVRIDLGGIAKGFAVDKAIETLRAGASSGRVNAGGDLRVFGPEPSTIHLRHPTRPGLTLPLLQLSNAAFATSAPYFARKHWRGRLVAPVVEPTRGRACADGSSASVQADTCLVADALTKVVMILGEKSVGILRLHGAAGFILTHAGHLLSTTTPNET